MGFGIKPKYLNDDRLGDVLDELYDAGLSEIFLEISLEAARRFGVKQEIAHLDSTSFHLDGKYEVSAENSEPGMIEITYGYSRDHRADLKQFVLNLICVGDGDIPLMMEIASGNQSDKARFSELLSEFKQQWTFEGLCVADGALYSTDNINAMKDLQWLTRVPLSIKEASTFVSEVVKLNPSSLEGYKLVESVSEYGGVPQRWVLIESEQRRKSDLKRLEKKSEQKRAKIEPGTKEVINPGICLYCRCHQGSTKIIAENDMA